MSCLMLTEMHNQALFTAKWFTLFRVETEKKLPYPVPAVDWYSTSTYLLPFTNVYASPMPFILFFFVKFLKSSCTIKSKLDFP